MTLDALWPVFLFHDGPWTEQDYLELPEDCPKIELIDGCLMVNPSATGRHSKFIQRLANYIEEEAPDELAVVHRIAVRVGENTVLIPDVTATYELGDQLVHQARFVPIVAEVVCPTELKSSLYAKAGIPWYLLVEPDEDDSPMLILQRLEADHYVEHARAVCGQTLRLPEPLGSIDPSDLLKRRR